MTMHQHGGANLPSDSATDTYYLRGEEKKMSCSEKKYINLIGNGQSSIFYFHMEDENGVNI